MAVRAVKPEAMDMAVLARRAMRYALHRTFLTDHELARTLNSQMVPGAARVTASAIGLAAQPDRIPEPISWLLTLRLAGLDLVATMERWLGSPRWTAPVVRPYYVEVPPAWRDMGFSSGRPVVDIVPLLAAALTTGRKRAGLTWAKALARINPLLDDPVLVCELRAMERGEHLALLPSLVALQVYGLDVPGMVQGWMWRP